MNEQQTPAVTNKSGAYWLAVIAGIGAIGAGGYLLMQHTVASNSIFNPLLHGVGVYFIARGVFMWWSAMTAAESRRVRCPACMEAIHREATVCPHCRTAIAPAEPSR